MKKQFLFLIALWFAASYSIAANRTSVTTATFPSALTSAGNGDTLLMAPGTYPSFTFQNGKTLVMKSNRAGQVKIGALSTAGTSVTNCGFVFDGVTIDTGGGSSNFSGGDVGNITKLSFLNDTVQNIGRCIFTTGTGGFTVDSVVFKNTIITDCGAGRYNLFWQAHAIKNFLVKNCTLKNYTNGESILCPRSVVSTNVLNFTFENNTVYNWSKPTYALVKTTNAYSASSNYIFRNNIVTEPAGYTTPLPDMIVATGGNLIAEKNLVVNFGSYVMTSATSSNISDLTLAGLGLTSIPFANPSSGDFSIASNSPLATASTTGGIIGDPRWLKIVTTPRQLTITISPSGAGALTPGSGTYNDGDQVTATATRNFGYQFREWQDANTGTVLSNLNPYIFKISSDVNLKGVFDVLTTYDFTSTTAAGGTVSLSPAATNNKYEAGTTVTATATKNFGYKFVEWRDANTDVLISKANPYTVIVNQNTALKPVFEAVNTYSLTVNTAGGAPSYMISASPAGTVVSGQTMYEEGTNVVLTASNNPILTFANWSTGETSSSLTIPMTQNKTFEAQYNASDYIVGWDFYKAGGQSRVADFSSTTDNATSSLILRTESGTLNSWLDKSIVAGNGYYDKGAAIKWKNLTDKYYYQISFDASAYKNIKVASSMLNNYNGYSKQLVQYSTDNTNFTTVGSFDLSTYRVWYDNTVTLPASVNNAARIYVRWIPDYTSSLVGITSDLDGTAIGAIYVTGTVEAPIEFIPPVLVSTVPASSATNASATGNIVLNFDEKIKVTSAGVTGTLNGKQLTPTVSGKTITFPYSGLQYNTQYTFTLAAGSVSDLLDNVSTTQLSVTFNTMNRPIVTKKTFDFVVGVDGDFKAALAAATTASSSSARFRIFFPNGQYNIGENTGDANQQTTISLPNVSYVGQNSDSVVLYNKNTSEGMGVTPTINFTSTANNLYVQDLSLKNGDYRSGVPSIGRCLALYDSGTKNIYKNVNLLSNQDTYFSATGRKYFEGGSIHGTVDYIFGGGDVFFNGCLLYMEGGGYLVAPNHTTSTAWGYVFSNCTIDAAPSVTSYCLGRPWQNSPKAAFLNTTMKVLPVVEGWSDWYTAPAVFAEYNSMTSTGAPVDLTMRRSQYGTAPNIVTVNPVLTSEQAATYTVENVLSGSDAWNPRLYTDQAAVPAIAGNGTTISWADNDYVLCWAILKNGKFQQFVTTNSYTIPASVSSGIYTVRAANEMGGLSAVSNTYAYSSVPTGVNSVNNQSIIVAKNYYTIDGKKINSLIGITGIVLVQDIYSDGHVETRKIVKLIEE